MSITVAELQGNVMPSLRGSRRSVRLLGMPGGGRHAELRAEERLCLMRARAKSKKWRQDNREHHLAYQRAYRAQNPGKVQASRLAWQQSQGERFKEMRRVWNRRYYLKRKASAA